MPKPVSVGRRPAIAGQLPIPSGQIVKVDSQGTPEVVDVPVSPHMAHQVEAARAKDREQLDERLKELAGQGKADTRVTDLSDLPPEKQAEALQYLQQTLDENGSGPTKSLNEIVFDRPVPAPTAVTMHAREKIETPVSPGTATPDMIPAAPVLKKLEEIQNDLDASALPPKKFCEHCGWDQDRPDMPLPDETDKQAFLMCVLGLKCFAKEYMLLGGRLKLRFRSLTAREIDTIYKQAQMDVLAKRVQNEADYYERINRMRLFLQLQRLETVDGTQLHDLPDGFTPETNPGAEAHWDLSAGYAETGLSLVEDYVVSKVLTTEYIMRIVHEQCSRFNRLLVRLEHLVDNEDFWKATSGPT